VERTTIVTDPQSNAKTSIKDVNGWFGQGQGPLRVYRHAGLCCTRK